MPLYIIIVLYVYQVGIQIIYSIPECALDILKFYGIWWKRETSKIYYFPFVHVLAGADLLR